MFGEELSESPRMPSPWSARLSSPASASVATSASTTAPTTPPPSSSPVPLAEVSRGDAISGGGKPHIPSEAPMHAEPRPISPLGRKPNHRRLSSFERQAAQARAVMEAKLSSSLGSSIGKSLDLRQEAAARLLYNSLAVEQHAAERGRSVGSDDAEEFPPKRRGNGAILAEAIVSDDDEDEEADGFFSLDMDLDIDSAAAVQGVEAISLSTTQSMRRPAAERLPSLESSQNAPSPLPDFRRDSKSSETLSPSFGPIAPEVDRRGNLEYKLKILPPSKERFDRLVTQLKWRLLEGGGLAVYEIGVLDDGTLIGLDSVSMKDSLKLLSAMAREVGARCEVRRVLALERRNEVAAVGTQPRINGSQERVVDQQKTPVRDALEQTGDLYQSTEGSNVNVRALQGPEAAQLLMPSECLGDTQTSGLEEGQPVIERGQFFLRLANDEDETTQCSPDETWKEEAEPHPEMSSESSDEDGFGFSLSIDGDAETGDVRGAGNLNEDDDTPSEYPTTPQDFIATDAESIRSNNQLSSGAAVPQSAAVHSKGALSNGLPLPGSDKVNDIALATENLQAEDLSHSQGDGVVPSDLLFEPEFAAIDVKGVQTFSLSYDDTDTGLISRNLAAARSRNGEFAGRRGRDGRSPFADPDLIVQPVSPTNLQLLTKTQAKSNVGKTPKRRGKRRGVSGWRIDGEEDRDGAGASLERRMRRLAELKAAERAGAGWTPPPPPSTATAAVEDPTGQEKDADRLAAQTNSIAQELVQQMLTMQLTYPDGGAESGSYQGGDDGRLDLATQRRGQPPFKTFDEKSISPFLALDDREIEEAKDADGIRELFQRKRQEMLKKRQAYKREAQAKLEAEAAATAAPDVIRKQDDSGSITFLEPTLAAPDVGSATAPSTATAPTQPHPSRLAKMKHVADSSQPKTARALARARNAAGTAVPATSVPVSATSTAAPPTGTDPASGETLIPLSLSLDTHAGYESVMSDLGMTSERTLLRQRTAAVSDAAAGAGAGLLEGGSVRLIVEAVVRRELGRRETFIDYGQFSL